MRVSPDRHDNGDNPVHPSIPLAAAVAFATAAYLTRRFCDPRSRLHLLDHPNERSLHSRPTPRSGGVAIVAAVVVATTVWLAVSGTTPGVAGLAAAMLLLAGVSFLDDRRGLPVRVRIVGHMLAAGLVVAGDGGLAPALWPGVLWVWPAWVSAALAVVFLVWMVNLYNFMDGMDGFAGGMAVIGFGAFALLGVRAGNEAFAAGALVVAAAAGGFLVFNFPPARIFMGDTGSSVLGLLAGAMTLQGAREGVFEVWVGVLVFSPFIVDATVTLVRRLVRGERVWQAHRSHYYQRLVQSGWGHRKTVLFEYGLMAACAASALLAPGLDVPWQRVLIGAWGLGYLALMVLVARLEADKR